MSWFGWMFSSSPDTTSDELEKVEILCDRINNSIRLEDKRESLIKLRELSKNCKLEVGTRSLSVVFNVIKEYSEDLDSVTLSLDIISNITENKTQGSSTAQNLNFNENNNLCDQFCEIVLKDANYIELLIRLIENKEYQVRWAILKILIILSKSQLTRLQSVLCDIHFGLARILNYLSESREFIRNDCIVLLINISSNNQSLQNILAYENIFELLWNVIDKEGKIDGSIVVQDCFIIFKNILNYNDCTQKQYLVTEQFNRFLSFLQSVHDTHVWSTNKINCFISAIQSINTFIDPCLSNQKISIYQQSISSLGIFNELLRIMSFPNIPELCRVELFSTIAECVRSESNLQNSLSIYLRSINSESDDLKVIISSLVNPKNSQRLKHSVLYLFQCYIRSNELLIDRLFTLLSPTSEDQPSSELAHAICSGFFDFDNLLTWISCSILSHIIYNREIFKSHLLKIHFEFSANKIQSSATSLLDRCVNLLQSSNVSILGKIHILSLMIVWMFENKEVSNRYLKNSMAISLPLSFMQHSSIEEQIILRDLFSVLVIILMLNNQDSHDNDVVKDLSTRLSLQELQYHVNDLTSHLCFISCCKSPRPNYTTKLLFDYEFACIIKRIQVAFEMMLHAPKSSISTNDLINQIHQKDEKIKDLEQKYSVSELIIEDLKKSCIRADSTPTSIDWQQLYNEINVDFQKLLEDYQKLLKVSQDQEEVIKQFNSSSNIPHNIYSIPNVSMPIPDINEIQPNYQYYDPSNYYVLKDMNQNIVQVEPPQSYFNYNVDDANKY